MENLISKEVPYQLRLADGSFWEIAAQGKEAELIVAELGKAMQLSGTECQKESKEPVHRNRLQVQVDANTNIANCYVPLASENTGVASTILSPCENWGGPFVNLVRLSLVFARETETRGGVLIHGALAVRDDIGVILTAPGGTGKTTASKRLKSPWTSLCDDTTLIVRDCYGNFLAHPWPTWSRYLDGGGGGSWDVQKAVPVKGFFFLSQSNEDRVERVGAGQAVSMLAESVKQASLFMQMGLFPDKVRALYLERFNNLCKLAKDIPAHILHISLTGDFCHEIEKALEKIGTEKTDKQSLKTLRATHLKN